MRTLVVLAGALLVTTLPAYGQSMLDNFIESYLRPRPPAAAPVERAEEPRRYRKGARDLRHARRARSDIKKRSRLRNLPTRPSVTPAVATVGAISGSIDAQPMTAVRTVNTVATPTLTPTSVLSPALLSPGPMSRAVWIDPPEPVAVAAIVAERWPRYEPVTAYAAAETLTGENTGAWGAWFLVLALPALAIGGAISWIAKRRRADEMLGGYYPLASTTQVSPSRGAAMVPASPRALDRSPNWLCAAGHSPNRSRS
jgi:hypothetical protein